MGLPIIASNIPLYAAIINDAGCGICIDPNSPDELSHAIKWLIENPISADNMAAKGKNTVFKHYNWEIEGKKLWNFYNSSISNMTWYSM